MDEVKQKFNDDLIKLVEKLIEVGKKGYVSGICYHFKKLPQEDKDCLTTYVKDFTFYDFLTEHRELVRKYDGNPYGGYFWELGVKKPRQLFLKAVLRKLKKKNT